jgi:hypothetical protein
MKQEEMTFAEATVFIKKEGDRFRFYDEDGVMHYIVLRDGFYYLGDIKQSASKELMEIKGHFIQADPMTAEEIADSIEPDENSYDYGCKCAAEGIKQGRLVEYQRIMEHIERLKSFARCYCYDTAMYNGLLSVIEKIKPEEEKCQNTT